MFRAEENKMNPPPNKPFVYWNADLKIRVAAIGASLLVGLALMAIKFYSYALTESSAILSDALESIINVVASAFAMGSILFAAQPPDESHPYGHGKIEYFSAGFEGALIILAAVGIFKTGLQHLTSPSPLPHLDKGLLLLLGAALVNLLLGAMLIRIGKRTRSLTLTADGKHVISDVYTSAGVIVGLCLVELTDWLWLDGAVACIVGAHILFTGWHLVRQSIAELMNASDPQLLAQITQLLRKERKPHWLDIHKLRAWRAGNLVHMDFHLVLPNDLTLEKAHADVRELENMLIKHFDGNASVLIHTDPCRPPHCPVCGRCDCQHRHNNKSGEAEWSVKSLTKNPHHG
jgi:cation diffusion facilitator family transporter